MFTEVERVGVDECDDQRVTRTLNASHLGEIDPDPAAGGKFLVLLHKAKAASCKRGKFILRTTHKFLNRVDHFALVPYNTETEEEEAAAKADVEAGIDPGCPTSVCSVLEVQELLRWQQSTEEGRDKVYWLVLGTMTALRPVSSDKPGCAHVYEQGFCDGSHGRRKRFPSLLEKPEQAQSHLYAVWLSQVEAAMVSAVNDQGVTTHFVPPFKSGMYG